LAPISSIHSTAKLIAEIAQKEDTIAKLQADAHERSEAVNQFNWLKQKLGFVEIIPRRLPRSDRANRRDAPQRAALRNLRAG
jgi:hypothetical protein